MLPARVSPLTPAAEISATPKGAKTSLENPMSFAPASTSAPIPSPTQTLVEMMLRVTVTPLEAPSMTRSSSSTMATRSSSFRVMFDEPSMSTAETFLAWMVRLDRETPLTPLNVIPPKSCTWEELATPEMVRFEVVMVAVLGNW